MTRGITYATQKFVDSMQGNFFPYGNVQVQLAMRPVKLWEVVFPKEALPSVLKGLNMQPRKDIELQTMALRKILKAKKIPKLNMDKVTPIRAYTQNMGIYGIGIREDGNHTLERL